MSSLPLNCQLMTLFSSPSYTTMPRNRACLFATDSRSTDRTVYLPVPFRLILLILQSYFIGFLTRIFCRFSLGSRGALVGHAGELHFSDNKASIPLYDENNRTFAVSTLASSSWSTPPMPNVYHSPSSCEPKSMFECGPLSCNVGLVRWAESGW